MTSVLLDTVGLIAVWDVDDQWHAAAENAYQRIISRRQRALTTTFILLCRNPVSVHHSCPEIRCQFIILARKDEPTPDYARHRITDRDEVRGPCPVHHSAASTSRSFSANLNRHIYKFFMCGSKLNQLYLYASVTGLSLFEAAIALCKQLDREIPLDARGKAEPGAR